MKYLLIFLCCLNSIYFATAEENVTTTNVIADGIRNFLEDFRRNMPCGFPESGIPPLVPLNNPFKPVNIDLNEFAFQGNVINLNAWDLNTFIIQNVDFSLVFMRMDFSIFYPFMRVAGQFGQGVGRSPNNCAIFGNGQFNFQSNGMTLFMSARILIRANGLLEMGETSTRITLNSFHSNIQNFVGTQAESTACNRMLDSWMPFLFSSNEARISAYMDTMLRPIFNDFVDGKTLQDLLNTISNPVPRPPCNR